MTKPPPPPPPPFPPGKTVRYWPFVGWIETRESVLRREAWIQMMDRRKSQTPEQRAIAEEVYRQVWEGT